MINEEVPYVTAGLLIDFFSHYYDCYLTLIGFVLYLVASDVCRMHKDAGPCEDYRVVWYFEPVGRHCRRFYYGGCGGNDNKFNSSEQCHSRCLWSGYGTAADDSHHHTYEAVIPQTTLALDAQVTPAVSAHVTPTSSSTHTTQALPMTTTRPSHHDEGQSIVLVRLLRN